MDIVDLWEKFKLFSIRFSQPHKHSKLKRYVFPILLIILIFPLKLILQQHAIEGAPYLLSTFIVILSAWYGGIGPGIFATFIAGLLSNLLFLEPRLSISVESTITTIIFIIQGIFISMISEAKRHADLQKDEFISFASHELKNPLAVLKGYNQILQKLAHGKNKKKSLEYLTISDAYINKLTNLINELLDVTKIQTGKLTLRKEYLDVQRLVQEIVKDQQLVTRTHKIMFVGNTKKKVFADKVRLGQVITNMITNAVKYSPGKKKVNVTLENKQNAVIISVQDFGIGLSKESQMKIFERYFRVKNTQAEGLGLGLYITQQIIKLHDGLIWVKSIPGKGSTFYCQLPTK